MFDSIGTFELLIILLVIVLLFGSKQLPELVKLLSKTVRYLTKASKDVQDEINTLMKDDNHLSG